MTGKKIKIINQKDVVLAPKQKLIKVHKVHDKCRDFNAEREARKLLKTVGGLKIRSYLLDFDDDYIWALSNDVLKRECDLNISAYNSGIKELIEIGYLVQDAVDTGYELIDKGQGFHFYESLELRESVTEPIQSVPSYETPIRMYRQPTIPSNASKIDANYQPRPRRVY